MPYDVMIDIETMGTSPRAAILSIGAVRFDPTTGEMGRELEVNVNLQSCVDAGLVIEPDTVLWWLNQDDETRAHVTSNLRTSLSDALYQLRGCVGTSSCVWANSPSFDLVILRTAYDFWVSEVPWNYWQERDVRTILALAGKTLPREKIKHTALEDARDQARAVSEAWAILRGHPGRGIELKRPARTEVE